MNIFGVSMQQVKLCNRNILISN